MAWMGLAVLTAALLFIGLDSTILNALPLSDQLGAEGSALRWIERAEAIASWSWTATVEIGLLGSDLLRTDSAEHALLLLNVRSRPRSRSSGPGSPGSLAEAGSETTTAERTPRPEHG